MCELNPGINLYNLQGVFKETVSQGSVEDQPTSIKRSSKEVSADTHVVS